MPKAYFSDSLLSQIARSGTCNYVFLFLAELRRVHDYQWLISRYLVESLERFFLALVKYVYGKFGHNMQRFVGPVVFNEVFIDAPPIIAVDAPIDEQLDSARAQDTASHGPVIHDGHLQHGLRIHYGDGRSYRKEVCRGFLG